MPCGGRSAAAVRGHRPAMSLFFPQPLFPPAVAQGQEQEREQVRAEAPQPAFRPAALPKGESFPRVASAFVRLGSKVRLATVRPFQNIKRLASILSLCFTLPETILGDEDN